MKSESIATKVFISSLQEFEIICSGLRKILNLGTLSDEEIQQFDDAFSDVLLCRNNFCSLFQLRPITGQIEWKESNSPAPENEDLLGSLEWALDALLVGYEQLNINPDNADAYQEARALVKRLRENKKGEAA